VTSFGAAFRLLKDAIEMDLAALKAESHDVYRPVVLSPEPAVHFLDCDGFRRVGRAAVQAQAAAPDWNDPLAPSTDATVDTDAYKTALVARRIVTRQPYVRPGQDLELVPGCLDDRQSDGVRRLFTQAAGERGSRRRPGE